MGPGCISDTLGYAVALFLSGMLAGSTLCFLAYEIGRKRKEGCMWMWILPNGGRVGRVNDYMGKHPSTTCTRQKPGGSKLGKKGK